MKQIETPPRREIKLTMAQEVPWNHLNLLKRNCLHESLLPICNCSYCGTKDVHQTYSGKDQRSCADRDVEVYKAAKLSLNVIKISKDVQNCGRSYVLKEEVLGQISVKNE